MPLNDTSQGCPPIAAASAARARWPRCSASNLPSATTGGRSPGLDSGRGHPLSAACCAADFCVPCGRADACCVQCVVLAEQTLPRRALPIRGVVHRNCRGGVARKGEDARIAHQLEMIAGANLITKHSYTPGTQSGTSVGASKSLVWYRCDLKGGL